MKFPTTPKKKLGEITHTRALSPTERLLVSTFFPHRLQETRALGRLYDTRSARAAATPWAGSLAPCCPWRALQGLGPQLPAPGPRPPSAGDGAPPYPAAWLWLPKPRLVAFLELLESLVPQAPLSRCVGGPRVSRSLAPQAPGASG